MRTIPAPYLDSDSCLRLVVLLRAQGYDAAERSAIVSHLRQWASIENCPAVVHESHRDEIAAALPGSFARWAAKARKAGR